MDEETAGFFMLLQTTEGSGNAYTRRVYTFAGRHSYGQRVMVVVLSNGDCTRERREADLNVPGHRPAPVLSSP